MRIAMVGTGYVGVVAGTCLADFGSVVTCLDKDVEKIERLHQGNLPIYEPGLADLMERNVRAGRLSFMGDLATVLNRSQVIFVAVGTEGLPDGRVNLEAVLEVGQQIARTMQDYTVIVIKSTVPVGTAASLAGIIQAGQKKPVAFDVVSNPEFQREGSAVEDFIHPARIVIGTGSNKALRVMYELYRHLVLAEMPIIVTTNETAELIKYAANAFLATKISFINEIPNLCDRLNCDVQVVAEALGLDPRIGPKFLQPGPDFGGSCFTKDTRALIRLGKDCGLEMRVAEAAVNVNEAQPLQVVGKVERHVASLAGMKIAVLGLAYKADTDDVRGSPGLTVCNLLLQREAELRVYDSAANGNARRVLTHRRVEFCSDAYEAARDADCVIVLTDWNEFRILDLPRLRKALSGDVLIDARNIINPQSAVSAGFVYEGMGRRVAGAESRRQESQTAELRQDANEQR